MIKQYVGARYVPKFYENSLNLLSNEWEENVNYEALTVVTYLNDSYTSKKPVPVTVGNPRNNPEYWALTGAYNAQIEEYRQEAVAASDKADAVDLKIGDLDDLDTTDKNDIVSAINEVNSKTTTTKNRKYLFIGDSYGAYSVGWIDYLITKMGLTLNTDCWKIAEGGKGWGYQDGRNFYTLIQEISATLTSEEKESITDIVMQGSVNDWAYNALQVKTTLANVESYIKNNYPNATLSIMCIGYGFSETNMRRLVVANYKALLDGARETTKVFSDCYKPLMDVQNMGSDKVHPTTEGFEAITDMIYDYLMGGKPEYNRAQLVSAYFEAIDNSSSHMYIYGEINNEGVNIYSYGGNLTFTSGKYFSNTNGMVVGFTTMNRVFEDGCVRIPVKMELLSAGNPQMIDGLMSIEYNNSRYEMKLYPITYNATAESYNYANITGVNLFFNCFLNQYNY